MFKPLLLGTVLFFALVISCSERVRSALSGLLFVVVIVTWAIVEALMIAFPLAIEVLALSSNGAAKLWALVGR